MDTQAVRLAILAHDDVEKEEIYVPEWGQKIWVFGISGAERDTFEVAAPEARETGTVRASLAVLACRDEDGKKIFVPSDVEALAGKSAAALDRIYDVAARLAGITKRDSEELEGN